MRVTRFASGGTSEYSTVATTSDPAPAANNISVPPGDRLTMRSGAGRTATVRPLSSVTTRVVGGTAAATPPTRASVTATNLYLAGDTPTACSRIAEHHE